MRWLSSLQNDEQYLIVGLGNPGSRYEGTRHNMGFSTVKALAKKWAFSFAPALVQAKGTLATGKALEKTFFLLLPLTYMNESGLAVKRCLDFYQIPLPQCLIVADDVHLPFGELRLRKKGSSGGHNGLKSVAAHLGTEEYNRLRIGIGRQGEMPLADYVLDRFTEEENQQLPQVLERAVETIEKFIGEQDAKI
jgi:PTH1 family peptidyl-tRNA hydrolase